MDKIVYTKNIIYLQKQIVGWETGKSNRKQKGNEGE